MIRNQFPTHIYHAYGYGVGAHIHKPFCETLPTQASASISATGGYSITKVDQVNFRDIIRTGPIVTSVMTAEETDSYDVVVNVSIEKVNFFDQVTCDRIVNHISSRHYKHVDRPTFRTIGTHFENLRIGGVPIDVDIEDEDGDNYGGSKPSTNHPVIDVNQLEKGRVNNDYNPSIHLTTLAKAVHAKNHRLKVHCNSIIVPDFGVVHLAEYLVTPNARNLTMLRVKFGCVPDGDGSAGGSYTNGQTLPPPPKTN